ncbi:MAG: glycosyltransferase family 117 protein [Gemmatimonadaceae bacterium]
MERKSYLQDTGATRNGRAQAHMAAGAVLVLSAAVFWRTAYPTITWWDSSSYSLGAATLGIESPPGSLLLTLLGWPVAHLPLGASPAHRLNLFAGLLAAITVAVVCSVALRLIGMNGRSGGFTAGTAIGAGLGALTLAFGPTLWEHAIKFTPYVLTTVFTGLILWTLIRWWEDADASDAWRWIALLGLLVGLDFNVHRTNALLVPGALAWILLRRPRTLASPRAVLAGAGSLAAGLSLQLLLIPMAAYARSPLDFASPDTLSRLWDYITIKQLGGSFLLDLLPRKAPLWSVQTMDLLRMLGANFFHWTGTANLAGVLPALAAIGGLVAVWRRSARLGAAWLVLLGSQAALAVIYFNIPANFFRPFDRHYLPVCVTIAVLVACGLGAAGEWTWHMVRARRRPGIGAAAAALVVLVPAAQLVTNWRAKDASRRWFTGDYAANALRSLPPHAIYFTVGDNDTFPVMYMQSVEGVRPDVTIINLSVANILDWPDRLKRRDPSLPLTLAESERAALTAHVWTDTTVTIPVSGSAEELGVAPGTRLPASITLNVRPRYGTKMLPAEIMLLDIVRTNHWRRPLTFATSGTRNAMEWLAPYGRLDGTYFRVVPERDPPADTALLRKNIFRTARYRGYAQSGVIVDGVSGTMASLYYEGLFGLLAAERGSSRCSTDLKAFGALVSVEWANDKDSLAAACH